MLKSDGGDVGEPNLPNVKKKMPLKRESLFKGTRIPKDP